MTAAWVVLLVGLAATTLIGVAMKRLGRPLLTPLSPNGIVDLELAPAPLHAKLVVDAWGPEGLTAAVRQTVLDYFWVLGYVAVLAAGSLLWAAAHRGLGLDTLAALGEVSLVLALLAGLLDWLENSLMLATMHRARQGLPLDEPLVPRVGIVSATRAAALAKFCLAGASAAYILLVSPLAALFWWLLCRCGAA